MTIKLLKLQKQTSTTTTNKEKIESGLDFIINHFDPTILYFPRTIMTKKLNGQIVVYAKEEALQYFIESEFQDCRINAYRYYSSSSNSIEQWTPDLLFIDIDRSDFKNNDRRCKLALSNTLKNIKEKLGGYPTVLSTGGGYHIYQPIEGIVFENYNIFDEFKNEYDLFKEFLRFSKNVFSNNKADKNNNPSLKSCLLRIPGSINSKYDTKVIIVQKWNGYRPPISEELLEDFRTHLIQEKIDEYRYRQKILKARRYNTNTNNNNIFWIEKLLNTPIADFRKNALSLILAPYLVHIKKLPYQESFDILSKWLTRCNSIRKLDFINSSDQQVKSALNTAIHKRIPPMKLETLKNRNFELYNKFYK